MTQNARPATVLTVMMIAVIYVIMLIGVTRSRYFIGGAALERAARGAIVATYQVASTPDGEPPLCPVPKAKLEEVAECSRAAQTLRRLMERPRD